MQLRANETGEHYERSSNDDSVKKKRKYIVDAARKTLRRKFRAGKLVISVNRAVLIHAAARTNIFISVITLVIYAADITFASNGWLLFREAVNGFVRTFHDFPTIVRFIGFS